MIFRVAKITYFATVCFLPPLCLLLYPLIFLGRLQVSSEVFSVVEIYFWVGALIVIIDLWRSYRDRTNKMLWTGLLLLLGIIAFPIYWYRFVLHDHEPVN